MVKFEVDTILNVLGYGLLFLGITLFWVGYHNFDSAQNMGYLNAMYDLDLIDYASDGKAYTAIEGYNLGISYLRLGLCFSLMSALCYGLSFNKEIKKK